MAPHNKFFHYLPKRWIKIWEVLYEACAIWLEGKICPFFPKNTTHTTEAVLLCKLLTIFYKTVAHNLTKGIKIGIAPNISPRKTPFIHLSIHWGHLIQTQQKSHLKTKSNRAVSSKGNKDIMAIFVSQKTHGFWMAFTDSLKKFVRPFIRPFYDSPPFVPSFLANRPNY